MLLLIGILIVCAFVLAYFHLSRTHDYWHRKVLMFDEATLFYGSMVEILHRDKHLSEFFKDLYLRFGRMPYIGYFQLATPAILINDPDLIEDVLVKSCDSFENRYTLADEVIDRVVAIKGSKEDGESNWTKWEHLLVPSKIEAMYDNSIKKCFAMTQYLHTKIGERVEINQMVNSFCIDLLASLFGVETNTFETPDNDFAKFSKSLFKPNLYKSLREYVMIFAPSLAKRWDLLAVPDITEELLEITKDIAKKCDKSFLTTKDENAKILSEIDQTNEADDTLNYRELAELIHTFLIQGNTTCRALLTFALYEIAANIDIQHKLRDEIDEALSKNNGKIPCEEIQQLPYLDMVVSETLRMYTPSCPISLVCLKPYILPPCGPFCSPLELEVGTPVSISNWGLHMNPDLYPEPDIFDPKRFTDENKAARHKFAFLPFGEGPRMHMGSKLGLLEAKAGIAGIIHQFELRNEPKCLLRLDPTSVTLKVKNDILLNFHPIMRGC